jgi:hypothetical protein
MPVAAPVQKGEVLKVGFGSFAYTGYIPEDGLKWKKPGDVEAVKDENNATITKIITDPRDEFEMSLIIKNTSGSITPPITGATVTITNPAGSSVACMCADADVTLARSYAKLTLSLVKEDSMTYS